MNAVVRSNAMIVPSTAAAVLSFIGFASKDLLNTSPFSAALPLPLCYLFGALACLVHCEGYTRYPGTFKAFQPFLGGMPFVVLQAMGWMLYAFFLCAAWIVVRNPIMTLVQGFPLCVGSLQLVSHLLLRWSLSQFVPPSSTAVVKPHNNISLFQTPWALVSLVAVLLSLAAFTVSEVMIATSPLLYASRSVFGFAWLIGSLSIAISHFIVGPVLNPSWKSFQPMQGGQQFILLQAIGWTLYGIHCNLALDILSYPKDIPIMNLVVICGIVGFFASMVLLISTQYFATNADDSAAQLAAHPGSKLICSVALFVLAMFLCGSNLINGVACVSKSLTAEIVLLMLAGPAAQVEGRRVFGMKPLSLWQPLVGGFNFICYQVSRLASLKTQYTNCFHSNKI
jgi:hypothetical protein